MNQQLIFAKAIAGHVIEFNAFQYDPFHKNNPMYVDIHKIMSAPIARRTIRKSLAHSIDEKNLIYGAYGITNSGIASATLMALESNKDLILKIGGDYCEIDLKRLRDSNISPLMESADVLAGTTPFGIILGIVIAEELQKGFLFVRDKPKNQNFTNQIEGIINIDDHVILIDPIVTGVTCYPSNALQALTNAGLETNDIHPLIDSFIKKVDLRGKTVVAVDDVFHTGESSLGEILNLMEKGVKVILRSVFSHEFEAHENNPAKYRILNRSALNFNQLIDEFEHQGCINLSEKKSLLKWHKDQSV